MKDHVFEDSYALDALKRTARKLRLQACRASPSLAAQLIALATLYEVRIERAADHASA